MVLIGIDPHKGSHTAVAIDGHDLDDASIAQARKHAAEAGVADRVRFDIRDASTAGIGGSYDLVFCVEMLHDVSDPVGILRAMRRLRAPAAPSWS